MRLDELRVFLTEAGWHDLGIALQNGHLADVRRIALPDVRELLHDLRLLLLSQELLVDHITAGETALAHKTGRPILTRLGKAHGLGLVLDGRQPGDAIQTEQFEVQHVFG
ncbi:hypothetical protein D3C84_866120 [compost metagenome]